jgi:hypothetical protein
MPAGWKNEEGLVLQLEFKDSLEAEFSFPQGRSAFFSLDLEMIDYYSHVMGNTLLYSKFTYLNVNLIKKCLHNIETSA